MFLHGLRRRKEVAADGVFPWTVPSLAQLEHLEFDTPVTFFMGENGSGKSTLLEAIAIGVRAHAAGSGEVDDDRTLDGARRLSGALVMQAGSRPNTRMFFRAEDAFGFALRVEREMRAIGDEADALLADEVASRTARERAAGYVRAQRSALSSRYGEDPHARSHGEAFLNILRERVVRRGLYLLDEPETPLSPSRVLALLALVHEGARGGSQFIIATHSPILAALPGAKILLFDGDAIRETAYEDLEHVRVTRDFLAAPQRYLRHLLNEADES